uniref:ABC transporter domain-containing protein n=1 Tax=Photinus pyralis TaxID=7054 RepID=A0A1Y1MCM6_PHOPY
MGKKFDKFLLLMWKNFLLQWRHPIQTIIQISTPVLFSFLLVAIRSLVVPESHKATFYTPFENNLIMNKSFARTIAWSPTHPVLEEIMKNVTREIYTKSKVKLRLISHNNSRLLEEYLMNELNLLMTLAGVQFDDSLINQEALNHNVKVHFRFPAELRYSSNTTNNWKTKLLFPLYQVPGPRSWTINEGGPPSYHSEGFLMLQQEVSLAIIHYFKPLKNNVSIYMQRFPYPEWVEDNLLTALQSFVGLIIMLSFVYTCISTVKIITTEKELQLKEAMKIMGLPNWLHWTAWFIKSFILLFVTVTIMVSLIKFRWYPNTNNTVFTNSNPMVILLFLVFYICAVITFCFAISVFFSKSTTASTIASILWFLSYFPYSYLQRHYSMLGLSEKLFASLGVNTAMAFGFQLILMFEGTEEGVQWHNIWQTTSPDDNLVLGHLMIMFAVDAVLYLLVALYVEAVYPGNFGVPRPWYFPLTVSYWCGQGTFLEVEESAMLLRNTSEFIEREPFNLDVGIKIQRLCKEYSRDKVAVRDLSLNIYKDQITVLLGHNGAGKTSTINMLTGMIPPTRGTAFISGYNLRSNINKVRENVGFCPQFNILFDELTVKEHLLFYCKLKGFPRHKIDEEVNYYIAALDLIPKRDTLASKLSGGMKRKLSIGVALCGGSKVVVCDEPTSGMDPAARKNLCDLLQAQKKDRTILLTTHYMDEADLLGDRIAIMSKGNLECCGSSFFLKKKYGTGYHLIMEKLETCDVSAVTALLQSHIPSVKVQSNIGSELSYLLPQEFSALFEGMLRDLETQSSELGVLSYGISLTTLEEVFTKVGTDHLNADSSISLATTDVLSTPPYCYRPNWRNQFLAMIMKRSLAVVRSWLLLFIQNFMVVFFLIIAVILARQMNTSTDLPSLKISLDGYLNPVIALTESGPSSYSHSYRNLIRDSDHYLLDWKNEDMTANIISEIKKNAPRVRQHFITGATFDNKSITAWFSNQPYHSSSLSLQLALNAILKAEVSANHSIEIYNSPLPFQLDTKLLNLLRVNNFGFQIAFNLGFSTAFISAFYVMFYIKERACKAKFLQFVSGVSVLPFWGAAFICDFLTFILTAIIALVTLSLFQEDGFRTFDDLGRIFSVFLFLGYAMLPWMYLSAYFFDIPSTGFTRMSLVNVFLGITAMLVVQILAQPELNLQYVSDTMHWILLLVPHYSFCTAVRDLFIVYSTQHNCEIFIEKCVNFTIPGFPHLTPEQCKAKICDVIPKCCTTTTNYYDIESPGIGRNVIFLSCVGTFLIMLLLSIELRLIEKITNRISLSRRSGTSTPKVLDVDVLHEQEKVRAMPLQQIHHTAVVMKDVTKYYGAFLAVDNLCVSIDQYECFGLLGVNGAGKTTTFKIMTGDLRMSSGEAWINGINLTASMKTIYKRIGYCPQFDALLDELTCFETLTIFSLIRGMSFADSRNMAKNLSHDLDFYQHLHKKVNELSGGNKRKLSTALALIGDPSVLFLDEPTSGMDPVTKRYIWNVLCGVRDRGKCIILTSHSMEECEALCTRSAIMVNGIFMCIGSTQHLKTKFSEGYTLIVKMKKQENYSFSVIEDFVKDSFGAVLIRERHQDLITFYIQDKMLPWSRMFGIMEEAKAFLNIEDYSLGQSSLEQVFLSFTKYQKEENKT